MQPFPQSVVRPRLQAGVSNLQIMISTLIGGILIMGGLVMIGQIDKAKVDNEIRELTRIKKKTVALGAQRGSLAAVTQENLIQLDFFRPETLSGPVGARVIRHQWGGTMVARPVTIFSAGDGILFGYQNLPGKACKALGMQLGDVASAIWVEGLQVKFAGQPTIDTATLITACDRWGGNVWMDLHILK